MKRKYGCLLLFVVLTFALFVTITPHGSRLYVYCRFSSQERQAYNEIARFGGQFSFHMITPFDYETGRRKAEWSVHLGKGTINNKSILPLKSSLETLIVKSLFLRRGELLTDEELKVAERLEQLTYLDIGDTAVTDASVPLLAGLPQLNFIYVRGTSMTEQAMFDFIKYRKSRSKLTLMHNIDIPESVCEELAKELDKRPELQFGIYPWNLPTSRAR